MAPRLKPDGEGYIGPNIVWDEDSPPLKFKCSGREFHMQDCPADYNCRSKPLTETEVRLINKCKEWNREGRPVWGVPTSMQHLPSQGILVEILDLHCRSIALVEALVEKGLLSSDELDTRFQKIKLEIMESVEGMYEETLGKKAPLIQLPTRGIIGPNGQPLS